MSFETLPQACEMLKSIAPAGLAQWVDPRFRSGLDVQSLPCLDWELRPDLAAGARAYGVSRELWSWPADCVLSLGLMDSFTDASLM